MNKFLLAVSMCAIGALAACGGGGGSGGTNVFDPSASAVKGSVAADLLLQVNRSQLDNTGTDTVDLTVTAVNEFGQTVSGVPVSLGATNGAVVTALGTATDESGKVLGKVSAGANRSNRSITVSATSGTITRTINIQVVGAALSGTAVPTIVSPAGNGKVTFTLRDKLNDKVVGEAFRIEATLLTPSTLTGVTNENGEFVYEYTAPTGVTGAATVSATAGGVTNVQTIQVGSTTVPDATLEIQSASVQAVPSVVAVNQPGSTTNRAEIRARFVGTGNRPVPNVRVRFDLADNANNADGTFSSGSDIIYTNESGIALTAYTPKTRSSPTNGVTVRACYGAKDTDLDGCPTFTTTTLTVSSEPLGVTIGTDNLLEVNGLTYQKKYVVMVTDAAGRAMAGVRVNPVIQLTHYGRGQYSYQLGLPPDPSMWVKNVSARWCAAEDANQNSVLESGEDLNGNNRLDPGPSDVSVRMLQTETRADGTAELQLQYPHSYGSWAILNLTVTASVAGTEGRHTVMVAPLPVLASHVTSATIPPAFVTSPYGTTPDCTSPF